MLREGLSTRRVTASDPNEIQLLIDPMDLESLDDEITGLRGQVKNLKNVSSFFTLFTCFSYQARFQLFTSGVLMHWTFYSANKPVRLTLKYLKNSLGDEVKDYVHIPPPIKKREKMKKTL